MSTSLRFALCLLPLSILALAHPAPAQDWAREQLEQSPRHGEWVVLEHGDRKVEAFIAYPEVKEPALGVIVIHEIFGLTDWVRTVADELAAAGYVAIAPDLLSGMGPGGGNTGAFPSVDDARKAISRLPREQIDADLDAAAKYLRSLPAVNGRIAVCGFCWGGSQTFLYAAHNSELVAAFPFYGSAPDDAELLGRIRCPVYGFFGGNDARVNSTLPRTVELMKAAGLVFEPVEYDGAGHGFMRAGQAPDASAENAAGRTDAWKRWKELLGTVAMGSSDTSAEPVPAALDFEVTDITGQPRRLAEYRGKVILVVNVASKCGLTPQYEQLQALYDRYGGQGLVILGFPCNQFLGQEPWSEEKIAEFCSTKYNVTFPMFSKIEVNGAGRAPLYRHLTSMQLPPVGNGDISWNFEKFLIGRDGQPRARFSPRTKPDDRAVIAAIESALADR